MGRRKRTAELRCEGLTLRWELASAHLEMNQIQRVGEAEESVSAFFLLSARVAPLLFMRANKLIRSRCLQERSLHRSSERVSPERSRLETVKKLDTVQRELFVIVS